MIAALIAAAFLAPNPVTIKLTAPAAKEVFFVGDLTGWAEPKPMTKSGSDWTITFDIPDDARFEYKFTVDQQWWLDPANPKKGDNGVGGQNSIWEGPKYKATTNEGAPKKPLNRSSIKLPSREITIFSPDSPKGLPILLYGDGPNYEKYGKIQNVVQNLVEAKKIKPVVIVLVPPVDRWKEYGSGWKGYADTLFNEILPAVRALTGASNKPEDLYVGGSSMGGLISLRLAEEFPDKVAGGVHSQSGAFLKASTEDFSETGSEAKLKQLAPSLRLWICWGSYEGDLTAANERCVKSLNNLGRKFGSKVTHEGHNWTAWRNRMEEALVYLLGR